MAESEAMEVEQEANVQPRTTDDLPDCSPIVLEPAPEVNFEFDRNGPRLMITHIVNENFKSYAGIQTLGPFHKSFSSIVGPNGSGKSNVIDSMLFVFGYRANKIRSKKISVLIHNSEDHPDLSSCTVAVHFQKIIDTGDGDEDFDVVPGSKFVVSRTAFTDSSSYYKVDGKKCTFKDVGALLRKSGIDLDHSRFLILQGEVESIAMMKPKALTEHDEGMLEFLEDIIGTSRFKEPISLLSTRVEELNDRRAEKLNRVKAVEKEKDELEPVRNEAIEFLTLENDIVKKQNHLYQKYQMECNVAIEKASSKKEEVLESTKETRERLEKLTQEKKSKKKEFNKIQKKHEECVSNVEKKKEEFSKYEQQDVAIREELKHIKATSKKLEKSLDQEKKKLEELKLVPQKSEKEIEEFEKELEKAEKEKAKEEEKYKEVMDSLKTETEGLQEEREKKEQELVGLQKAVNETKQKMNIAQSEIDILKSNQKSEQTKLKDTAYHLETAEKSLKERTQSVNELQTKLPSVQDNLREAKAEYAQVKSAEEQETQTVRALRTKVEESRSNLESTRSRGDVLDGLMKMKRSGKISGLYGRLGDLGAIDDKYDVAISTACGPLDNIVCDTLKTAEVCVEYLRKSGLGCATFIALDKQQYLKDIYRRKVKMPEGVPRLFDLVKVQDEAVLPAFYYGLRDTLVAKDMDQATRIAYGATRYRVVTLGGELIDVSGTMSGGGTKVSSGRMGSSVVVDVDPKELHNMQQELERATQQAQKLRGKREQLESSVKKLEKEARDLNHTQERHTMEIQSLKEQVDTLKKQKAEQQRKVKEATPDEKTLKQLEKKVGEFRKEYEKAQEKYQKVDDEKHKIHKQIMDIGGNKLKAAESKLIMINTHIDQITGRKTKASVAKKTAQKNTKKCEDKISDSTRDLEEAKEREEKLKADYKNVETEAAAVMAEHEKLQTEAKEVDNQMHELYTEIEKREAEENILKKQQIDITNELEKYENVIKENQQRIKHWKKELGKLKLHVIEDEEQQELETVTDREVLEQLNKEEEMYAITVLEEKKAAMKPNMAAIAEYKKKEEAYLKRVGELDYITDLRDKQKKNHEDLRKQRLDEFMKGFSLITNKLKEMYQMITLGGDAELELVDSLDPFSEGIVFSVRPPKKSWKNICNLSGGEKTLSSLALVFALHHYKPTPLYVMDEIDAALDFKNVSIVANYIKERTKNAQFIIISLRNNMFELADRLIGIYKTYNCTKSVTINPKKLSMPLGEVDSSQSSMTYHTELVVKSPSR